MANERTKMDRNQLDRRWSGLDLDWSSWRDVYQDCTDFVLPFSGRYFVTDRNLGNKRYGNIFDETATYALNVLGAGLQAGMTSPARPWFRLQTADPDLNQYHSVKLWLNESTRRMLDLFQRSNAYGFLHSMYQELGVYGTAATFLMDDFNTVIHGYPLTCGEYRISANYRGEVDTVARRYQKTVAQVVKEFGYANCTSSTKALYDNHSLDSWITITQLVEPNADRDPSKRDAQNMAWKSWYQEDGANDTQWLRKSGYNRFPAICPRWSVYGGDIYGNSPAMLALGSTKQLQHEQLRKAEAIDFQTKPPLQVPMALANRDVQMLPGGLTFVDSTGPQNAVRSMWDVNLNLQYLQADIVDVRQRINRAFFVDMFLSMSDPATTRMTATEVAERHEEKLTVIGPTLERLHDEALNPLVEYVFDRMMSLGLLPPPPPEMEGQNLNIEFVSILAQAQRAVAVNGTDRFVMGLGQVAAIKPDVLDKFNADEWTDQYADMLGVDPRMLVGNEQVAIIRQQRAQAQQAQAATAMAEQAATAAQKLGSIDTGRPNGLSDLLQQFSGYTLPGA
jgi:hypothetical protein